MASPNVASKALDVNSRPRLGRGGARESRRAGLTPAIIYGGGQDPVPVTLSEKRLQRELQQGGAFNSLYSLSVDGKAQGKALLRDIQRNPLTDRPVHADFLRVTDKTQVRVAVPVRYFNHAQAPGLIKGGILAIVRHEFEVDCLASDIPDEIACDLAGLELNETIHVSRVDLPPNVEPAIRDRDFVLANITGATIAEVIESEEEQVEDEEEEPEA